SPVMSADGSLAGSAPGRSKRQPRVVVRTLRSLALFGRKRALPRSAPSARNPHPLRSPSPAAMLDEPLRDRGGGWVGESAAPQRALRSEDGRGCPERSPRRPPAPDSG